MAINSNVVITKFLCNQQASGILQNPSHSVTQSVSTQVNLRAGARARPATARERILIMQRACSVAYIIQKHTHHRDKISNASILAAAAHVNCRNLNANVTSARVKIKRERREIQRAVKKNVSILDNSLFSSLRNQIFNATALSTFSIIYRST
jgi:hypothetical protein